jgi:hypothetical protein
LFSSGQVDVIAGLNSIGTHFQCSRNSPRVEVQALTSSLFPLDRINIKLRVAKPTATSTTTAEVDDKKQQKLQPMMLQCRLALDRFENYVLFVVSAADVRYVCMPWLEKLSELYQRDASQDRDERMADIVKSMQHTSVSLLPAVLPARYAPASGFALASDPMLGRYIFLLQPGARRPFVLGVQRHATSSELQKQQKQASGGGADDAKATSSSSSSTYRQADSFGDVIDPFIQRYQNFQHFLPSDIDLKHGMTLTDPNALSNFFRIREQFERIQMDQIAAQKQITQRVALLSRLMATQKEMFADTERQILGLRKNNRIVQNQVAVHKELQSSLLLRIQGLVDAQTSSSAHLSDAEIHFQRQLLDKKALLTQFKRVTQEMKQKSDVLLGAQKQLETEQQQQQPAANATRLSQEHLRRIGVPLQQQNDSLQACVHTVYELQTRMQRVMNKMHAQQQEGQLLPKP